MEMRENKEFPYLSTTTLLMTLSPHLKWLLPHVANCDKVGQHCISAYLTIGGVSLLKHSLGLIDQLIDQSGIVSGHVLVQCALNGLKKKQK